MTSFREQWGGEVVLSVQDALKRDVDDWYLTNSKSDIKLFQILEVRSSKKTSGQQIHTKSTETHGHQAEHDFDRFHAPPLVNS